MGITLDDVTLPTDLIWSNEFKWDKKQIKTEYSINGSLIVQASTKKTGRIITLEGNKNTAWTTRETLLQLQTKAEVGGEWVLTWTDARTFNVMIISLEAEQLIHIIDPDLNHLYKIILNLLEI